MKRFVAMLLILGMVLTFTACGGKKFTCAFCGKDKKGTQHPGEQYGKEIVICDDCYNKIKLMVGA